MFNWTKDKVIQPPTTTKSKVKHIHPNLIWLCCQQSILVWVIAKAIIFPHVGELQRKNKNDENHRQQQQGCYHLRRSALASFGVFVSPWGADPY